MANKVRWYKRDPNAALEGMACLALEERGAYNTVLDLIYTHDGSLDDDDKFIAGWCRCDVRVWKRIRARLLELGKLYLHAGQLRNERADREVDAALRRIASAAQAGLASAAIQGVRASNRNDLASTPVQRPLQLSTPTSTKSFLSLGLRLPAIAPPQEGQPTSKRPDQLSRVELDAKAEQRRGGAAA